MGLLDQQNTEIEAEDTIFGRIGEMGTADSMSPDLPIPADFLERIKNDDESPLFVTAEVESGWSRSKRNWKPEHLQAVVKAVNENTMGGVLGHPLLRDSKAYEADFPKPQVVWVKASAKNVGGKMVAKFKGYVLKTAEAREYLKLGLIDGVSIFGETKMKPVQGGYDVISFVPESIDFARKGRSGMTSRIVSLAGEQTTGGIPVDAKDIAAISEDEIRAHNPLLVKEIERKALETVETKVGEQATLVADLQPKVEILDKIKELLKLSDGDNIVDKVESLLASVDEATVTPLKDYLKELVSKKIKTPRVAALVNREIVGEMVTTFSGQELTDDLKKKIEDDFTKRVSDDSELSEIVGEMAPFSEERGSGGTSTGGANLGGRSRAGTHRGRTEDGSTERRGGLVVTKRKLGA